MIADLLSRLTTYLRHLNNQHDQSTPELERISRYKIKKHPIWGYCAFYDESPDPKLYGRWWKPIRRDLTTLFKDAVMMETYRGELWLPSEELAGTRINRHAANDGITEIWRG